MRSRLNKAADRLNHMRIKSEEDATEFQVRAEQVIEKHKVEKFLAVTVEETITEKKRYLQPGRPTTDTPYEMVEQRQVQLHVARDLSAIKKEMRLAGWRLYVNNVPAVKTSQEQAVAYYPSLPTNIMNGTANFGV